MLSLEPSIDSSSMEHKELEPRRHTHPEEMQRVLTVIGALLIRLTNGMVLIWGSVNVYYLSWLSHKGLNVSNSTNSLLLLSSAIPIPLLTVFSTRLANRFGYELVIQVCGWVFLISPLMINYLQSVWSFTIFYLILPGASFAVSATPLLNILVTQFPSYRTRMNSLLIVCLGVSTFVSNFVFAALVNPNNEKPQIFNGLERFSTTVTDRLLRVNNLFAFVCGACFVGGSMMLTQRKQETEREEAPQQSIILTEQGPSTEVLSSPPQEPNPKEESVAELLSSRVFVCLFLISLLNSLLPTYTCSYFKIIFMPLVGDDYTLTLIAASYSLANIFGAIVWGYFADKKGVVFTLMAIVSVDSVLKLLSFGLNTTFALQVFYPLAGLLDKGTLTVVSPGLIQLFGIRRGTSLIPFRQLAVVISYSILPISQLLTKDHVSSSGLLKILSLINLLTLIPAIVLFAWKRPSCTQIKQ